MRWILAVILILLIIATPAKTSAQSGSPGSIPGAGIGVMSREVPAPLRDAWLRFHESDLCLNMDTIFVFQATGIEVWCRAKDEKSLQELNALLEPLKNSYRICIYATRSDREKKPWTREDDDPPPSLWNNSELRNYLRDPSENRMGARDFWPGLSAYPNSDPELGQRLKLFSDQTLEWSKKMERLAIELPSLTGVAYSVDAALDVRQRARAVCLEHAREIGKYAGRLLDNLSRAFPRGSGAAASPQGPKNPRDGSATPFDNALQVSAQAQALDQRITRFFYPQAYTVTLPDLREPMLLELMKDLQQKVSVFERSASRFPSSNRSRNVLHSPGY